MKPGCFFGWDIGGAHLKMAGLNEEGGVEKIEQHPTPLWKGLDSLRAKLSQLRKSVGINELAHVLTTTGELADVFQNRKQGVESLLSEFCQVFSGNEVQVYAGSSGLLSVKDAIKNYRQVASANWHASASYLASQRQDGVLVDIGSSTTDIIPFQAGRLLNRGYSDQERMQNDELLYTGMVRTPLMAVVKRVPFAGVWQSVAAEHFACMSDIYRITGDLDESHDLMPAADGGEKNTQQSVRRLSRMLGCDVEDPADISEYRDLASYIAGEQEQYISRALQRVMSATSGLSSSSLIGAGTGRFIVARLARRLGLEYINVEELLTTDKEIKSKAADCLAAVSVAQMGWMTS